MKVATTLAFGVAPHAIGKDHPEGVLAGVHSNYHFTYPGGDRWPLNKTFVQRYFKRWNEYPNFQSEGAYVALYMLKDGDRARQQARRRLAGGRGDHQPARRARHAMPRRATSTSGPTITRATRTRSPGSARTIRNILSLTWDLDRVITIPIRNITAPANWPKPGNGHNELTAAADWIKKTWPKAVG